MPVEPSALLEQNLTSCSQDGTWRAVRAAVPGIEQDVFRSEFQRVMCEFEKLYGQVEFAQDLRSVKQNLIPT